MTEKSREWPHVKGAIGDIVSLATVAGAKPMFFLIPSPATVYSQFVREFKRYDENHEATSQLVRSYLDSRGAFFMDFNERLREFIKEEFLFVSESDCHFNTRGMEMVFRVVHDQVSNP